MQRLRDWGFTREWRNGRRGEYLVLLQAILLIFLDIKARREETWLTQKYPEYTEYQQRVKKLIPGLY